MFFSNCLIIFLFLSFLYFANCGFKVTNANLPNWTITVAGQITTIKRLITSVTDPVSGRVFSFWLTFDGARDAVTMDFTTATDDIGITITYPDANGNLITIGGGSSTIAPTGSLGSPPGSVYLTQLQFNNLVNSLIVIYANPINNMPALTWCQNALLNAVNFLPYYAIPTLTWYWQFIAQPNQAVNFLEDESIFKRSMSSNRKFTTELELNKKYDCQKYSPFQSTKEERFFPSCIEGTFTEITAEKPFTFTGDF